MARRVLLIMLVGAGIALAACGSDEDSPEPSNRAGTSDRPNPRAHIPEIPEIPSAGGSDGRGSGDAGSTGTAEGRSRGTGGGSSPGGTERRSRNRSKSEQGTGNGTGSGDTPPRFTGSEEATYSSAREICANVTLQGIAVNLRLASRDAAVVAKAFSRRYPAGRREAAYEGCREGFRNQVDLGK